MNPTLTKAAQALSESLADWQGNGDLPTFAVVAVLKAIYEPDDEMIEAGFLSLCDSNVVDPIDDRTIPAAWQAMIDRLLTNQTTNPTGSGE